MLQSAASVQVLQLYNLAARNGEVRGLGRRSRAASPSWGADVTPRAIGPSEGNSRALKRLAEQAAEKMAEASSRTDFKEAAIWRDRRNLLLSAIPSLEESPDSALEDDRTASASG